MFSPLVWHVWNVRDESDGRIPRERAWQRRQCPDPGDQQRERRPGNRGVHHESPAREPVCSERQGCVWAEPGHVSLQIFTQSSVALATVFEYYKDNIKWSRLFVLFHCFLFISLYYINLFCSVAWLTISGDNFHLWRIKPGNDIELWLVQSGTTFSISKI